MCWEALQEQCVWGRGRGLMLLGELSKTHFLDGAPSTKPWGESAHLVLLLGKAGSGLPTPAQLRE